MPGLKGSFLIAVLAGATAVMGWAAYVHYAYPAPGRVAAKQLTGDVWVSEQITPLQVLGLQAERFATIVDLRPDGEQTGQPSSLEMADAAARAGLAFSYDPVPHGVIPKEAVSKLQASLATQPKPILLYCRSGRRAARTWALAEASRPGGLDARSIEQLVQTAGQSVDDLEHDIQARIAARPRQG
jgi:uncharacterized protein (TIGR01244 family)